MKHSLVDGLVPAPAGETGMREALEKLTSASAVVLRHGAATGPQWVALACTLATARAALFTTAPAEAAVTDDAISRLEQALASMTRQMWEQSTRADEADRRRVDVEEGKALLIDVQEHRQEAYQGGWDDGYAEGRALALSRSTQPQASGSGWRPISEALKDQTPILVVFKNPIPRDLDDLRHWDGAQAVLRHPGVAEDGFDIGWAFAGPVGYGGFPDEWIAGWLSLPSPPAPTRGEPTVNEGGE